VGNVVSLHESLAADPRLRGHKPNAIVIDENDEIYISVQDAAAVAKLSPGRIRGLVSESRLVAIKPGGHDLFILLDSVDYFLTEGRKTPGRPPKDEN
jgi:hypothetical protein